MRQATLTTPPYMQYHLSFVDDRRMLRVNSVYPNCMGLGIVTAMFIELAKNGMRYPLSDLDLLANKIGAALANVRDIVQNYELFDVYEDDGIYIICPTLDMWMQPFITSIEKKSLAGQKSALKKKLIMEQQILDLSEAHSRTQKQADVKLSLLHSGTQIREDKIREYKRIKEKYMGKKIDNGKTVVDVVCNETTFELFYDDRTSTCHRYEVENA